MDPEKRMAAADVLSFPWIKGNSMKKLEAPPERDEVNMGYRCTIGLGEEVVETHPVRDEVLYTGKQFWMYVYDAAPENSEVHWKPGMPHAYLLKPAPLPAWDFRNELTRTRSAIRTMKRQNTEEWRAGGIDFEAETYREILQPEKNNQLLMQQDFDRALRRAKATWLEQSGGRHVPWREVDGKWQRRQRDLDRRRRCLERAYRRYLGVDISRRTREVAEGLVIELPEKEDRIMGGLRLVTAQPPRIKSESQLDQGESADRAVEETNAAENDTVAELQTTIPLVRLPLRETNSIVSTAQSDTANKSGKRGS